MDCPHSASVIPGLGLPLSHSDHSSCLQYQHCPQPMNEATTTRPPTRCFVTFLPTSATVPMNSCPSTSPARIAGMYPPSRCRSDPQVTDRPTSRMTSWSLRIVGSGTSSTPISLTPRQVTAFIRSEEHTLELQSRQYLVCRLLLEKNK